MMRSLSGSIPPGAETGVWQLLGFLADTEACGKRMAEFTAIRDEIDAKERAVAAREGEATERESLLGDAVVAHTAAVAKLADDRAALEAERGEHGEKAEADRAALTRAEAALSNERAAFDRDKVEEMGKRATRGDEIRTAADKVVARERAVAEREAAAVATMAEAEALKAEHERLVENAKKLLAGG